VPLGTTFSHPWGWDWHVALIFTEPKVLFGNTFPQGASVAVKLWTEVHFLFSLICLAVQQDSWWGWAGIQHLPPHPFLSLPFSHLEVGDLRSIRTQPDEEPSVTT